MIEVVSLMLRKRLLRLTVSFNLPETLHRF
jgi:hypothetical protein